MPLDPKNVTRYIRPKDIPLIDRAILDGILHQTARDLAASHTDISAGEWEESLYQSLLNGDILIVIDDTNKRLGLVPADRPPFLGLDDETIGRPSHADPLNLKKWEKKDPPTNIARPDPDG